MRIMFLIVCMFVLAACSKRTPEDSVGGQAVDAGTVEQAADVEEGEFVVETGVEQAAAVEDAEVVTEEVPVADVPEPTDAEPASD